MIALVGYPWVVRNSFLCGDQWMEVTWDGVFNECNLPPVVLFHTWTVASFVPPPLAKRDGCHGHHATAYKKQKISSDAGHSCTEITCLDCGRMIPFRPSRDAPRAFGDITDTTVPDVHDVVIAAARE